MSTALKAGQNCIVEDNVTLGENVVLGHNVIIESGVQIGENTFVDNNAVIRTGTTLGNNSYIGANCILGESLIDFCMKRKECVHPLNIGNNALIRSGSIIYAGSNIGDDFQTGHNVTIREQAEIGNHVNVGTLSDIQGNCKIGNYVRMHSNVHIGKLSEIDDFVWIFPYVILTNDPTPPSEDLIGVHIKSFAIVATGAIVMPGIQIEQDSLIAAGAIVTKNVNKYEVIAGNPGKIISDIRKIKNKVTGVSVYPWRKHFKRYMPWEECDFETWYNSMDIEDRLKIKL